VYQRKKLDCLPLLVRKVSYNSQFSVSKLEFNVHFQHKYGYIRDETQFSVATYLSCCGIFDGDCYRLIPTLI